MSAEERRRGVVISFDAHAGLGEIQDTDGSIWPFHCVSLADGTRQIEIDTRVDFVTKFHVKRVEAFDIQTVK